MYEVVISIDEVGHMFYINTQDIDLDDFGGNASVTIRRASNVEFNNETHEWEVEIIATGEKFTGFKNRYEALEFEVKLLQRRIMNGETTTCSAPRGLRGCLGRVWKAIFG